MAPGTKSPKVIEVTATVASRGQEDPSLWLWEAIQGLQAVLDQG